MHEVMMAGYGFIVLFLCLWSETELRSIKNDAKTRTKPISSNLDHTCTS